MNRHVRVALVMVWMYKYIGCIPVMCLGVLLATVGGYVIVSQVILWLKSGQWVSLPLLYLFVDPWPLLAERFSAETVEASQRITGEFSDPLFILRLQLHTYFNGLSLWLMEPKEWIGVQKIARGILQVIPVSLFLLGLGGTVGITAKDWFASAEDTLLEELPKEEK